MNSTAFGGASARDTLTSLGLCLVVWQACRVMYPGFSWRSLRRLPVMLSRTMAQIPTLRRWWNQGTNPVLAGMLERHPILPALSNIPYVNTAWGREQRVAVVRRHYEILAKDLAFLALPAQTSSNLASLESIHPGLRVVADQPKWFVHEGEVALSLFCDSRRLYSLVFTVGEEQGGRVAYVGAMQGISSPDALDIYRQLTHAAHGMRPRDLLFASFRFLCKESAIQRILAVSNDNSARRSDYFESESNPSFSYDETWQEYGGQPRDDGFYLIDVEMTRRDGSQIPSRKRALYRRRYDMLDSVNSQIAQAVHERAFPESSDEAVKPVFAN